jgi:hypothetical protein
MQQAGCCSTGVRQQQGAANATTGALLMTSVRRAEMILRPIHMAS